MNRVREFMCDDVVENFWRREDEAPVEIDGFAARARAPASASA